MPVRRIGRLPLPHQCQRRAEPFILHDRAGFHGLDLLNIRNGTGGIAHPVFCPMEGPPQHPKGIKVSENEIATIHVKR